MYGYLYTELPSWHEHEHTRDCQLLGSVQQALQHWQHVRSRFARARGRAAADVAAQQRHGDRGRLNRGRMHETHLLYGLKEKLNK